MTIRVTSAPQYFTPVLDSIYIAGTFNAWTPGDTAYMLVQEPGGDYVIELNGTDGEIIEFKFTRGDWARVETQADGSLLPNRVETFVNGTEKSFSIADWDDTNGSHTISGTVIELDYNFYIPQLDRTRRIWIYLPPAYYTSTTYYPVIYMHDGQNVFDQASSFAGEWDADGTMQTMITNGHTNAIIVGIANGEADRLDEYTPWEHPTYGGGEGAAYAAFIVETLKPYIDAHYRTLPERENTVTGGSSLGGLIAYYMALEYDSVFGKAFVFSPSFWFDDSVNIFTQDFEKTLNTKIYFTAGLYEDVDMVPDMEQIIDEMADAGFTADEYISVIRADGAHSEWFWKRELDDALLWLFEDVMPLEVMQEQANALVVYDSAEQRIISLIETPVNYKLYNISGALVAEGVLSSTPLSFKSLTAGTYIFHFNTTQYFSYLKIAIP